MDSGQPQSQNCCESKPALVLASTGARPFLIPQRHLLAAKPAPDGLAALSGLDRFLTPKQHLRASCSQDGTWRAVRAWVAAPLQKPVFRRGAGNCALVSSTIGTQISRDNDFAAALITRDETVRTGSRARGSEGCVNLEPILSTSRA
jgi:hypothetical protein